MLALLVQVGLAVSQQVPGNNFLDNYESTHVSYVRTKMSMLFFYLH